MKNNMKRMNGLIDCLQHKNYQTICNDDYTKHFNDFVKTRKLKTKGEFYEINS